MKVNKWNNVVLVAILISILFVAGPVWSAEKPASFYKGKTVEILVGSRPGGGYDTWTRLFGRQLKKHLKAKNVIVVNMPGSGGGKSLNHIYEARGTGGLMLLVGRGTGSVLAEVTGFPGTDLRWKCAEFTYIGRLTADYNVLAVHPKYKTIADMKADKEVLFASHSPLSDANMHASLGIEAAGLKNARIVVGYEGTSSSVLAIAQGEVEAYTSSYDSLKAYFESGDLRPMWFNASEPDPQAPNVPSVWEFGPSEKIMKFLKWADAVDRCGRTLIAPPDVPKDRADYLRSVMAKICASSEFNSQAKKLGRTVRYIPGDELKKLVLHGLSLSDDEIKELIFLISKKYVRQ